MIYLSYVLATILDKIGQNINIIIHLKSDCRSVSRYDISHDRPERTRRHPRPRPPQRNRHRRRAAVRPVPLARDHQRGDAARFDADPQGEGLGRARDARRPARSEEHTSEIQSLTRISYAA